MQLSHAIELSSQRLGLGGIAGCDEQLAEPAQGVPAFGLVGTRGFTECQALFERMSGRVFFAEGDVLVRQTLACHCLS
jgi:hypothetical protein